MASKGPPLHSVSAGLGASCPTVIAALAPDGIAIRAVAATSDANEKRLIEPPRPPVAKGGNLLRGSAGVKAGFDQPSAPRGPLDVRQVPGPPFPNRVPGVEFAQERVQRRGMPVVIAHPLIR